MSKKKDIHPLHKTVHPNLSWIVLGVGIVVALGGVYLGFMQSNSSSGEPSPTKAPVISQTVSPAPTRVSARQNQYNLLSLLQQTTSGSEAISSFKSIDWTDSTNEVMPLAGWQFRFEGDHKLQEFDNFFLVHGLMKNTANNIQRPLGTYYGY